MADIRNSVDAELQRLLLDVSLEVTASDKKAIESACKALAPGTQVFIANLPKDSPNQLIAAASTLRAAGLVPVPHIVARNIIDLVELDELLARLVNEARLDRALILAGDRGNPHGVLCDSLQLLESGLFEARGIKQLYVGTYPEGHPRINNDALDSALERKMMVADRAGITLSLVSQFCFDAKAIEDWTERVRRRGISLPLRIGLAGPASRASLIRYAVMCGVGPSLKLLREQSRLAHTVLAGDTPEALIRDLAEAQACKPHLRIDGLHFFTFGSLSKSVNFVSTILSKQV